MGDSGFRRVVEDVYQHWVWKHTQALWRFDTALGGDIAEQLDEATAHMDMKTRAEYLQDLWRIYDESRTTTV